MPTLMLVNPRKRRASGAKKRRAGPARKRRAAPRRSNPVSVASVRRRARRAGPALGRTMRRVRRRRNPINMGSLRGGSLMRMLKDAAVGGAGAVGVDILMAKINPMLPASLQPSATGVGANDALRVAVTVFAGKFLSKATKGMSERMAAGALTVQAARLLAPVVAKMAPGVAGIGYMTPNPAMRGNSRIGPNIRAQVGMNAYTGGPSPLLAAYARPGGPSPLLSGGGARSRETVRR